MKDMHVHGHVVFCKGDRVYSVNRKQKGYIISPLNAGGIDYLAVRYEDRSVFVYEIPTDIPDNIYPLKIYDALIAKHMISVDAPIISSRYRDDVCYIRKDRVEYDYSQMVLINPPMQKKSQMSKAEYISWSRSIHDEVMDIFDEAQNFTGKGEYGDPYSPVDDYLEYQSDNMD